MRNVPCNPTPMQDCSPMRHPVSDMMHECPFYWATDKTWPRQLDQSQWVS